MKNTLKSNRVFLRPLLKSDIDFLLYIENNPNYWSSGDVYEEYSREDLNQFLDNKKGLETDLQDRLVICLNEDNSPIGLLDIFNYSPKHQYASLGIIIDEPFQNKGFAKEALLLALKFVAKNTSIKNLTVSITDINKVSIKLFESVGFLKVGVRKNWFKVDEAWCDEYIYQYQLQ